VGDKGPDYRESENDQDARDSHIGKTLLTAKVDAIPRLGKTLRTFTQDQQKRHLEGPEKPLSLLRNWRRRSDSNRCIEVLQTSPLPLGYAAPPSLAA
jgi:hypothetical protein